MRTTLIYAAALLFVYSCNTAEDTNVNEANTITDTTAVGVPTSEEPTAPLQEYNYKDFNALVVTHEAPAYTEAQIDPMSPISYDIYTLLSAKKGKREPLAEAKDECHVYGYHWYETTDAEENTYWMSGEYLFIKKGMERFVNDKLLSSNTSFTIKGEEYKFGIMRTSFETPPNPDGYIDCPIYALPFLYKSTSPTVYPFYAGDAPLSSCFEQDSRGSLIFVLNSDGCGAFVEDFKEVESGVFEFKVGMGFQDGGLNATFKIIPTKSGFDVVDFVTEDMYEG